MGIRAYRVCLYILMLAYCEAPAMPHLSLSERLRQVNTKGDEHIVGLLEESVLFISQTQMQYRTFLTLRPDTVWNTYRIQTLLTDSSFLPRQALRRSPPTVLGTLVTASLSAELAVRQWNRDQWSPPELLSDLNSPAWDGHPSISPDGEWLIFASDRPGGWGGLDLYLSRRLPNGRWTPPENMGPHINTPSDDAMPWFLPDGRFVFASRGVDISGRWKLLIAAPIAPGHWERILLLPPPFSSEADDMTPILWQDTLLFASNRREGQGGYDLFAFALCGPVHIVFQPPPSPDTTVSGTLIIEQGGQRLQIPASGQFSLPTSAFQHLRIRYKVPCSPEVQLTVSTPCDFFRSVVYRIPISPLDTIPEAVYELPFAGSSSYHLSTSEHAWGQLLHEQFTLRSFPPPGKSQLDWETEGVRLTEQRLDSLVNLIAHLTAPGCRPLERIHIIVTGVAEPNASALYTGPPVSVAGLQLLPGTLLEAPMLAQLRAYTAATELRHRLSPLPNLRWETTTDVRPGFFGVVIRVRFVPRPE